MSFIEERCIALHCDECGTPFGDGGAVHFGLDERAAARTEAADIGWGITVGGEWCPPCWALKKLTPKPSNLPQRRPSMPDCNTPEKARYRSAAQAKRHHRDSYWTRHGQHASDKPKMRAYLCPSGEHWHLTTELDPDSTPCGEGGAS